ncbi:long-chain fatty acid--CoA ligase [Actinoplanes sp. N902-109]|uniref:acyl-CoA synthetase n=1 Tax=Actinoplanes sp. (strain N902-109) TaxID=649831 RepID=UPI0003295363|nr:long-chain fatty acid--CoA ligase [Actinoplanes sp. N902-109]AGL16667.1 AMP-dependent synthetase and ligase [Actinoplanes sp. N902-109]
MPNTGLGGWPARRAAISPDRTAMVFAGRTTTYAEFAGRVGRLTRRLHAAGVRPGDRVAYLGANHPAFVETMFATYAAGAIFVPLNARLAGPEIDYLLDHSGARLLIHAQPHATELPSVSLTEYEAWLAAGGDAPGPGVTVAGSDPACILYTSGTTGRPKGAVLTHDNIVWNTYNLLVGVDVAGDEVTLVSAPLFHVAALHQCLLPTVLKGGCSVLMPGWDVDGCYDLIDRHRVTWMFGVTAMYAALAASPRWPGADLGSIRRLLVGGAAVPPALIHTYQQRGLTFCQGYGMTETAPGATFLEAPEAAAHPGSAGPPVFFADVRCVRPDLTETGPGEPGEVLVRGPNVTPGYWNDPGATRDAFTGGWFRSGDIAVVDEHGHFRIVDRVKDMYISGGENVYPAEVEAVLFAHPTVAEAAVVGVPDDTWGETGRAFLVPAPGHDIDADEIRTFLTGRLARYKIPRYIDTVAALPRTGSAKVRKEALRALPLPAA